MESVPIELRSWRDVLDATLCDKVCQGLVTGQRFSAGTLVSSTNKTDRHDITEILLKVALNTITLTPLYIKMRKCAQVILSAKKCNRKMRGSGGRDRMVVRFTFMYVVNA